MSLFDKVCVLWNVVYDDEHKHEPSDEHGYLIFAEGELVVTLSASAANQKSGIGCIPLDDWFDGKDDIYYLKEKDLRPANQSTNIDPIVANRTIKKANAEVPAGTEGFCMAIKDGLFIVNFENGVTELPCSPADLG